MFKFSIKQLFFSSAADFSTLSGPSSTASIVARTYGRNCILARLFLSACTGTVMYSLKFRYLVYISELGTRYFFPGSLIANSLFLDHGSLSLNR